MKASSSFLNETFRKFIYMILPAIVACAMICCCFTEGKASQFGMDAPASVLMGEDIVVTVNGCASGETITLTLLDQDNRILDADREVSDGKAVRMTLSGRHYIQQIKKNESWRIHAEADQRTEELEQEIQIVGSALAAPKMERLSATEISETFRITTPENADKVFMTYVFVSRERDKVARAAEDYDVVNGQVTLTQELARNNVWIAFFNARTDGRWTNSTESFVLPGIRQSDAPTVMIEPTATADPETLTVKASGWNGDGVLVSIPEAAPSSFYLTGLTFIDGAAEITPTKYAQGKNRLYAILFDDEKPVSWSEPVDVTHTDGDSFTRIDYYAISAELSGTRKAGEAMTVTMSTPDSAEKFWVEVYNADHEKVWSESNTESIVTFPLWVFNEPGFYQVVCGINDQYLEKTLALTIGENIQQPTAPAFDDELELKDDVPYLFMNTPDGEAPDLYYYDIQKENQAWSTNPECAEMEISSFCVYANRWGAGNYKARACVVKDGVCSPWSVMTYQIELGQVEIDMPDTVVFGQNYTITAKGKLDNERIYLTIHRLDTEEQVYFEVDTVNDHVWKMDGSFLEEGQYIAVIHIISGTTVKKEFSVVGSGLSKPTVTAEPAMLTGPGIVTFTIYAPDAEYVYLSGDGSTTESVPVVDGKAVIELSFGMYKNKTYEFYARAQANGINSVWSDPVTVRMEPELPENNEWSEPTYTWSADKSTYTAERHSLQDETIVETETIQTYRVVLTSPTESTEGSWYRETIGEFKNNAFKLPQTETGTIPALKDMKVLRLPEGTRRIDREAFRGIACEAILIPASCEEIDEYAFADNEALIYMHVPSTVQAPLNAIENCPHLVIDSFDNN